MKERKDESFLFPFNFVFFFEEFVTIKWNWSNGYTTNLEKERIEKKKMTLM